MIDPAALQVVLSILIGWLDREEREAIAYLIEESRLHRQPMLGGPFNFDQRACCASGGL